MEIFLVVLEYGFEKFGLKEVFVGVYVDNIGFNKVLQKVGFWLIEVFEFDGDEYNWYGISKFEWLEKKYVQLNELLAIYNVDKLFCFVLIVIEKFWFGKLNWGFLYFFGNRLLVFFIIVFNNFQMDFFLNVICFISKFCQCFFIFFIVFDYIVNIIFVLFNYIRVIFKFFFYFYIGDKSQFIFVIDMVDWLWC